MLLQLPQVLPRHLVQTPVHITARQKNRNLDKATKCLFLFLMGLDQLHIGDRLKSQWWYLIFNFSYKIEHMTVVRVPNVWLILSNSIFVSTSNKFDGKKKRYLPFKWYITNKFLSVLMPMGKKEIEAKMQLQDDHAWCMHPNTTNLSQRYIVPPKLIHFLIHAYY